MDENRNDILQRIKYFIGLMHNEKLRIDNDLDSMEPSVWTIPSFVKINEKKSKRINSYIETEIWEKSELQTIIKYDQFKRK